MSGSGVSVLDGGLPRVPAPTQVVAVELDRAPVKGDGHPLRVRVDGEDLAALAVGDPEPGGVVADDYAIAGGELAAGQNRALRPQDAGVVHQRVRAGVEVGDL